MAAVYSTLEVLCALAAILALGGRHEPVHMRPEP
jgi:hypothetical protein